DEIGVLAGGDRDGAVAGNLGVGCGFGGNGVFQPHRNGRGNGLGDGEGGRDVEAPVAVEGDADVVADRLTQREGLLGQAAEVFAGDAAVGGFALLGEDVEVEFHEAVTGGDGFAGAGDHPFGGGGFFLGRFPVEGAILGLAAVGEPEGVAV